jgi:hypothetical protein
MKQVLLNAVDRDVFLDIEVFFVCFFSSLHQMQTFAEQCSLLLVNRRIEPLLLKAFLKKKHQLY